MKKFGYKLPLGIFALLLLIQFGAAAYLILKYENVFAEGLTYKFKCAPVDPYDVFRGRYVTLNFEDDKVPYDAKIEEIESVLKADNDPKRTVYFDKKIDVKVHVYEGDDGFAKLSLKENPDRPDSFLYLRADRLTANNTLQVKYPFTSFYVTEKDAPALETGYNKSMKSKQPAYLLVSVKNGVGVVKDLYIGGLPSKEFLEKVRMESAEK